MSNFSIYFQIGFNHITNFSALDHILFMMALTLRYQFANWKKLLVLITAFTIGHTITLGLCILDIINLSNHWIELLIPITIAVTAFNNLFIKKFSFNQKFPMIYWFALIFGSIHGLGFSNDLKSIIGSNGLFIKLFAANLGIEVAQICFMILMLIIGFICNTALKLNRREYILFLSGAIVGVAIYMIGIRI